MQQGAAQPMHPRPPLAGALCSGLVLLYATAYAVSLSGGTHPEDVAFIGEQAGSISGRLYCSLAPLGSALSRTNFRSIPLSRATLPTLPARMLSSRVYLLPPSLPVFVPPSLPAGTPAVRAAAACLLLAALALTSAAWAAALLLRPLPRAGAWAALASTTLLFLAFDHGGDLQHHGKAQVPLYFSLCLVLYTMCTLALPLLPSAPPACLLA